MRLPAVAIAAAFACGIVLGLHPAVARNASAHLLLSSLFIFIAVLVLAGILFVRAGRLFLATAASLLSWISLGLLGVCIAGQPRDANHVISLVEQGRLPLKTPLRWHGHLRDEPTRLPWGLGYEIDLSGVEFEEALLLTGGNDGRDCRTRRIFLSPAGTIEFRGGSSADSARSKTARAARFQLSIDVCGYRLHCGDGAT